MFTFRVYNPHNQGIIANEYKAGNIDEATTLYHYLKERYNGAVTPVENGIEYFWPEKEQRLKPKP